jgi:hypothetical protein
MGIATSLATRALGPRHHPVGFVEKKSTPSGALDADIPSGYDGPIGRNSDN